MMPKFALSMLVALAVCAPLQEAAAQESTLGGALFGDFRFGRVFVYHNGAHSSYGARAFRGLLKV